LATLDHRQRPRRLVVYWWTGCLQIKARRARAVFSNIESQSILLQYMLSVTSLQVEAYAYCSFSGGIEVTTRTKALVIYRLLFAAFVVVLVRRAILAVLLLSPGLVTGSLSARTLLTRGGPLRGPLVLLARQALAIRDIFPRWACYGGGTELRRVWDWRTSARVYERPR
jgi:hypothetical protein